MIIEFTPDGWDDFEYWIENDLKVVDKIKDLIKSIRQTPFSGLGKPEPLKLNLTGFWSRRITGEHRLIYVVSGKRGSNQRCSIIQCRFHYKK